MKALSTPARLVTRRRFLESFTAGCALGAPMLPGLRTIRFHRRPQRREAAATVPGKTGAQVSALALGGVIGMQMPPSAGHDPGAIAETALDLGVTYFDTAPSYNNGQSEANYAQVLARRRNEVFLATKTGDRTHDGTLRSVEQSLKRLQTDHVDLIQIHGVSPTEDLDAWEKPTAC